VELLRACIDSIERNSSYRNYEIIVVDNNSDDPATLRYLDQVSHRVVRYALAFNYSAINNLAAATATGGHFVFLNNDTEVITNEWLEVLLEHSQRKEVGVVGAKLLFGNGQVQHGGVVLGLGGQLADHAFRFADRGDAGYLSSLVSTRNYSAVTGACMMMRAEVFRELNGFDEEIQVVYSDVDLCLRVWGEGYRVVWTPHALLYHHEARTRKELTPQGDVTMFMRKWAHLVTQTDRFYHPDLSVRRFDFSLDV
jgi:GT2 family glycosyltransferase